MSATPPGRRMRTSLIVLAASVCAALGVLYSVLWPLAPFGLGLFFYALWFRTRSSWGAFFAGAVFGVASAGSGVAWFWNALPLSWLNLGSPVLGISVLALTWLVVTLSLALPVALLALYLARLRTAPMVLLPLAAGISWALVEQASMWGFALLTFGPGSLFGPHFSAASLGYPLAGSPFLIWLVGGGGVAGLALAAGFMGGGVALVLKYPRARNVYAGIALACAATVLLHTAWRHAPRPEPSLEVALLTADVPIDGLQDTVPLYDEMFAQMADEHQRPDIVGIPEDGNFAELFGNETAREAVLGKLGNPLVVYSVYTGDGITGDGLHEVLSYATASGTVATYGKRFLMPLGEYAPTLSFPLFSLLKSPAVNSYLSHLVVRTAPQGTLSPVAWRGAQVGALMCSEILSPLLYRQLGENGADVLVDVAHPSWFRNSALLFDKTLEIAKTHAVENHAFFLAAENGAPSFAISPTGKLLGVSPAREPGILFVSLPSGTTRFEPLMTQASTTP